MNKKILIILIALLVVSISSFSQNKGKIGLSGTIQGSQLGISVPMWLGENFVLAPSFSLCSVEKTGTDLSFGLAPRFFFQHRRIFPYFGLKAGAYAFVPSKENTVNDEKLIDIYSGMAFGGEFFVSEYFSFGVEAQGNFTKSAKNSERFGNPDGINFSTATMVYATLYF